MKASDGVLGELKALAKSHAARLEGHWSDEARPHAARLLTEAATVAVRAAAGEDVSIAQIALDASIKNLARAEQAVLQLEGRQLALSAALSLITKLASA